MNSRERILARARGGAAFLPAFRAPTPVPALSQPASADLAARFAEEAKRSDAELIRVPDRARAIAAVSGLLAGQGVLAWELGSLGAAVAPAARSYRTAVDLVEGRDGLDVGLTACRLAIADTGSLVLAAGPGCPREASLVVRTHVALVDPADLVPDLPTALAQVAQWVPSLKAHVNIITGPSRTADIEMTLTRGVHGPKRLVIILGPWRPVLEHA